MSKTSLPSLLDLWTEPVRLGAEFLSLQGIKTLNLIGRNTPEGDDHPVMVVPAFLANDNVNYELIDFLTKKGYTVYDSSVGWNTGVRREIFEKAEEQFLKIYEEQGRGVSLIGHSLGGMCAVYLAYQHPDKVRQVIALGSPFGTALTETGVRSSIMGIYNYMSHDHPLFARLLKKSLEHPPACPVTSVFSYGDGIVHEAAAMNPWKNGTTENVRVPGSHLGLCFNPLAYVVIADRLALREGEWRPFDRRDYPWVSRLFKKKRLSAGSEKQADAAAEFAL